MYQYWVLKEKIIHHPECTIIIYSKVKDSEISKFNVHNSKNIKIQMTRQILPLEEHLETKKDAALELLNL